MYEFELTLYHFNLITSVNPLRPKPRPFFLLRVQQCPEKEWRECWTSSDIQEGYSKKIFMCGKIVGQANMLARPSDPLTAPPPLSTDLLISYQPVIRCHYHNTMSTWGVGNTTPPPGLALVANPNTGYYFLVLTHSMIRGG